MVQLSDDEDSPDAIDRALDQTINLSTSSEPSFGDIFANDVDSPAAEPKQNQSMSNSNSESETNDTTNELASLRDSTFMTALDSSVANTSEDTSFMTAALNQIDFDGLEI